MALTAEDLELLELLRNNPELKAQLRAKPTAILPPPPGASEGREVGSYHARRRLRVMAVYGGKCYQCQCTDTTRKLRFTISDEVDEAFRNKGQYAIYSYLIEHGHPQLIANHRILLLCSHCYKFRALIRDNATRPAQHDQSNHSTTSVPAPRPEPRARRGRPPSNKHTIVQHQHEEYLKQIAAEKHNAHLPTIIDLSSVRERGAEAEANNQNTSTSFQPVAFNDPLAMNPDTGVPYDIEAYNAAIGDDDLPYYVPPKADTDDSPPWELED